MIARPVTGQRTNAPGRVLALLLALVLGLVIWAGPQGAAAQGTPQPAAQDSPAGPDYSTWQDTATRAEDAIETGRASNVALEELRAEIVGWREAFLSAQSTNGTRLSTLRTQIEALGPVPENGEESEEIAARRAELGAEGGRRVADGDAPRRALRGSQLDSMVPRRSDRHEDCASARRTALAAAASARAQRFAMLVYTVCR